jgi:anti-anti-sigma factor
MSPHTFRVTLHEDGSRITVRFQVKELSDAFINEVGDDLTRLADAHPSAHFLFDLSDIDYVSSAALGKFVALHKRLGRGGGKLTLRNVEDFPYEVFCVTRLHTILDIRRKSAVHRAVSA